MTEDLNSRTASVIGDSAEEDTANPDRDDDDFTKEEGIAGDPVVDDEPEALEEDEADNPEQEPLKPDEPT